jgi:hypothetical protein
MALPNLPLTESRAPPGRTAIGHAIGTVLFFAVFGPLIGGAIVGFRDIATVVVQGRDLGTIVYFLVAFGSVGVPAAYVMGLAPAALAGAFFAVVDYRRVRSDPWLAVVVGALGGMLWPVPWGEPASALASPLEVQILVASVASTFACWFASIRGLRGRREASTT